MRKLNRKGYLTIEIILASVMAVAIAFFLIDLTMKLVDTTDNAYVDTVLVTDKALITKNVKENLENAICSSGVITSVSCINNVCNITMNDDSVITLSVNDNIVEYTGSESYTKKIDDSLSNIKLTSSNSNNYYNFKISGENIFIDDNYDMNIFVYNGC